jgi:hypothetical protein
MSSTASSTGPPRRAVRHRLHFASTHDDLGVHVWPHPLDPGETLTTEDGRRFKVTAVVDCGADAVVVDRLLEVEPEP